MSWPIRVVLDTNIVLDCFVFEDAATHWLVADLDMHRLVALTRADCLAEFDRVLAYPQFALDAAARAAAFARYRAYAVDVDAPAGAAPLPRCADPDDQKFLELARDGGAEYLVSKDKRVLELARRRSIRTPFRIVDIPGLTRALER